MKLKYLCVSGPLMMLACVVIFIVGLEVANSAKETKKKIVLLSGDDFNHASGTHEFHAGCLLLKNALESSVVRDSIDVTVVNNWPEDTAVFEKADVIVHYYKGNQTHFINKNQHFIDALAAQGSSQMFMHYAVDPDSKVDSALKRWTGAVYKDKFSTNPHWPLQSTLQNHPINRGVEAYQSLDEWYVNMDFETEVKVGYDSPDLVDDQVYSVMHGENVDFKKAKKHRKGFQREMSDAELTVFWAKQRSGGGRGVGITGGHYHVNWANNAFRMQVLNAIAWCAKLPIPETGIVSHEITEEMINENLDARKKGGLKRITLNKSSETAQPLAAQQTQPSEAQPSEAQPSEAQPSEAQKQPPVKKSAKRAKRKKKQPKDIYKTKKAVASNVDTIHPFFALENIDTLENDDLKIGGMCFDGEVLYVATLSPDRLGTAPDREGKILRVDHVTTADGQDIQIETHSVVSGLYEPCAITVIAGNLYVGTKDQILRFDNATAEGASFSVTDGVVLVDGLSTENFHTYTIGFEQMVKNGETYLCGNFTTAIVKGGRRDVMAPPNPKVNRGSTFVIGPIDGAETADTITIEYLAGGYRTPNGIEVGPDNEVYVTDNQGIFNPSNELIRVEQGGFYGHYLLSENGRAAAFQPTSIDSEIGGAIGQNPATVHLPQATVARSPAQPHVIRAKDGVLAPYDGQILLCEFTTGALLRVVMDQVDGVWQGVAFQHSGGLPDAAGNGGFTGGPNRIELGPDGNYYIGQIGAGGLWQYNGRSHGLQRLRVKPAADIDASFNEILKATVVAGGFEIEFLKPLTTELNPEDLVIQQWTYIPTNNYGGSPQASEKLTAREVMLNAAGNKATILIDGLKDGSDNYLVERADGYSSHNTGYVVHVQLAPESKTHAELYTKEFWYTLHKKIGGRDLGAGESVGLTANELIEQKFQTLCLACHSSALAAVSAVPELKGLLGREQVVLKDGKEVKVKVDRDYLINAILNPESEKVPEYKQVVMPQLGITPEEAAALADYIINL